MPRRAAAEAATWPRLCVRSGRDGVACCCACTSLEAGLLPQARQRAEAAPSICRWCTYVGAAVRLELCSCLHATVLFIQCVLFLWIRARWRRICRGLRGASYWSGRRLLRQDHSRFDQRAPSLSEVELRAARRLGACLEALHATHKTRWHYRQRAHSTARRTQRCSAVAALQNSGSADSAPEPKKATSR